MGMMGGVGMRSGRVGSADRFPFQDVQCPSMQIFQAGTTISIANTVMNNLWSYACFKQLLPLGFFKKAIVEVAIWHYVFQCLSCNKTNSLR